MNTEPKYTNVDDHKNLDKMADMVVLNLKHDFSAEELKQESAMLAQCITDKQQEENNKKVAMSVFKNKIDTLQGEINLHASNINHGFTYVDKATVLYRDLERQRRVYFDKATGDYLKDDPFQPSDFQKKLEFDTEENIRQGMIEENNATGDFAEGTDPYAPIDGIIIDKAKKGAKTAKLKPVPSDNLHPNYGKGFETEEE